MTFGRRLARYRARHDDARRAQLQQAAAHAVHQPVGGHVLRASLERLLDQRLGRQALCGREPGRTLARFQPPAPGLRAHRRQRRQDRPRRVRDLRRPEGPRGDDRLAQARPLGRRRAGLPGALGGARAACSRRLRDAAPPDPPAAGALEGADGGLRSPRGELARGDREPQCHGRGQGPGHGGPLQTGAANLARSRRGARARA